MYLLFLQVMAEVRDFKQVNMTGYTGAFVTLSYRNGHSRFVEQ